MLHQSHAKYPFMIGLGASAGGLEAIVNLLTDFPRDFPAAFVVITHLDPTFSKADILHIDNYTQRGLKLCEAFLEIGERIGFAN